jgi:hypothetical protein
VKWKKRKREIRRLARKHGGDTGRAPMPDLSVKPGPPSLSATGVAPIVERRRAAQVPPPNLIVDTLHKQGPQVIFRDDLPWAGGKKS